MKKSMTILLTLAMAAGLMLPGGAMPAAFAADTTGTNGTTGTPGTDTSGFEAPAAGAAVYTPPYVMDRANAPGKTRYEREMSKNYFNVSEAELAQRAGKAAFADMGKDEIAATYRQIVSERLAAARATVVGTDVNVYQMIDEVLLQIISYGMNDDAKVKAVYDFLIYNFTHTGKTSESLPEVNRTYYTDMPVAGLTYQIYQNERGGETSVTFDDPQDNLPKTLPREYLLLINKHGVCGQFSSLMYTMLLRMDIAAQIVSGVYLNRDGTRPEHVWNRVVVDGKAYWYDVDVEGSVYRRGSALTYYLYKKGTEEWRKTHDEWETMREGYYAEIQPVWEASSWADGAAWALSQKGLLPEALMSNYRQPINRLEFAALCLSVMEGLSGSKIRYGNGDDGDWWGMLTGAYDFGIVGPVVTESSISDWVGKAYASGIMEGVSADSFDPYAKLTREQAAVIACKVIAAMDGTNIPLNGTPAFTDADTISDWAVPYVAYIAEAGIINGTDGGEFKPKGELTREQAMVMVYNMIARRGW
jgi:hypothetical protein